MYNRLIHIQNEFSELGETLFNEKVIEIFLRVMLMLMYVRSWKSCKGYKPHLLLMKYMHT
jgi:hypothetical protein